MNISFQFIILMGIVSLLGDVVYEGGRSVVGPYLHLLGASSLAVGIIAGLGEFLGYTIRILSGYVVDKTALYWPMTTVGYAMLGFIPLAALPNSWQFVGAFFIMERIGKGIRTPARDTLLSYATRDIGRGRGFGLHEALDQIGAIGGPFIFSTTFFLGYGYKKGFAVLGIPAVLCMFFLTIAKRRLPNPKSLEAEKGREEKSLPKIFWIYCIFISISILGFSNFQLISFHLKHYSIISDKDIPIFYAIAMGVDAISAIFIGRFYDKKGLSCLIIIPMLTFFIPLLAFSKSPFLVLISMFIWGTVMGAHETIMRAAVADIVGPKKRGIGYGLFNTIYGFSFFLSSSIMGYIYAFSTMYLVLFCISMQLLSILFFIWLRTNFF